MLKKANKGYLQISFAWLFAIIAGIFILALAIYFVVKIVDVGEIGIDSETAKQIGVLTSPLETNYAGVKATTMTVPAETRIHNYCELDSSFGQQRIKVNQKSRGKWTEHGLEVPFASKYLFSERIVEGKKFHLISSPFNYPFKVGNVVAIISESDTYCFIDAPNDILNDMSNLQTKGILVENCSNSDDSDIVKVCFESRSDCDMVVSYNDDGSGYVEKGNNQLYFSSGLVYGAIFADTGIYECQVKRLMARVAELSLIYQDKASFVELKDCSSDFSDVSGSSLLSTLRSEALGLQSSQGLALIDLTVEDIANKNDPNVRCRLW